MASGRTVVYSRTGLQISVLRLIVCFPASCLCQPRLPALLSPLLCSANKDKYGKLMQWMNCNRSLSAVALVLSVLKVDSFLVLSGETLGFGGLLSADFQGTLNTRFQRFGIVNLLRDAVQVVIVPMIHSYENNSYWTTAGVVTVLASAVLLLFNGFSLCLIRDPRKLEFMTSAPLLGPTEHE